MKPRVRIHRLDLLGPDAQPWWICEGDGVDAVGVSPRSAWEKWKDAAGDVLTPLASAWQEFVTACIEGRNDDASTLYRRFQAIRDVGLPERKVYL